ncbi:MAG TPA: FemAB family PEP-CTERM system-associated protein [Thiobacillaceae bacterium]|nr:FemAB family PEP-CTERM system-associated protein [Thiobacillaceae bacterium]HNU64917.1 FemAB family PEP-CTERM system-associated protein [Thiobacillaceae bacterium]
MSVGVRVARREDAAAWDAFVLAEPTATFFHRFGWKTVLERAFGHHTHFLLAERDGRIQGVLPLAEMRSRLFGHSLVSTPFCVYGGIAAATPEAHAALDARAQALARELGVGHLEYRDRDTPAHAEWPGTELYVTFRKDLDPDVEKNMLAIPRKQRAMVRKGIKHGLVAELESGVEDFFRLFADNVHRHGTPALPRRFFAQLREVFGDDCEVQLVRTPDGQVVSGVLSFYFRDEILPYYAGDLATARSLAANDFKYWELMRRACERGIRVFDYGRSKVGSGPYDFKRNWGFEPQPLHYGYKLVGARQLPENNPNNPKYRLFIQTWQRLPRPLANFLGPYIVRNLG